MHKFDLIEIVRLSVVIALMLLSARYAYNEGGRNSYGK